MPKNLQSEQWFTKDSLGIERHKHETHCHEGIAKTDIQFLNDRDPHAGREGRSGKAAQNSKIGRHGCNVGEHIGAGGTMQQSSCLDDELPVDG